MTKILWKYMDTKKFQNMIETSSLFFAFKNYFRDGCEGEDNPHKRLRRYITLYNKMELCKKLYDSKANLIDIQYKDTPEERIQQILKASENNESCYIVDTKNRAEMDTKWLEIKLNDIGNSCWTKEENFSKDMVHKFANDFDYVAIKSSLEDILRAFDPNIFDLKCGDTRFYHNDVEYHQDYDKAEINVQRDVENLYHMGSDWDSEKEYRFSVSLRISQEESKKESINITDQIIRCLRVNKGQKGFRIPINLNLLNMEIHCPKARENEINSIINKCPFCLCNYRLIAE